MTATREKWLQNARAAAALQGIELHVLDHGEFTCTRGPVARMVASRADLVAVLRLMHCFVEPEPAEAAT